MSALQEPIESLESGRSGDPVVRPSSPNALMCAKMAPLRTEVVRLGFTLLERDCSSGGERSRRCVDTFVHASGTWLDLVGNLDAKLSFGPVLAKFRTWALERSELIEVATVAATPLWRSRLARRLFGILERIIDEDVRIHLLHSAADLALELTRHQSVLRRHGLTPLIAGDDALGERAQWQLRVRRNLWLIAPP